MQPMLYQSSRKYKSYRTGLTSLLLRNIKDDKDFISLCMNNEDLPQLIADNTLLEWFDELDGFSKIALTLFSLYIESNNGNNGRIQDNKQTTGRREGSPDEEQETRPDTEERDDVHGSDGESLSEY